jgi:Holliday junction resolvase RusA-like endonuclease
MSTRIKKSFGSCHFNDGACISVSNSKYELDYTRRFYLFDVIPIGAVRMTQSDKWKVNPNHADPNKRQRAAVTMYFNFKNTLLLQAKKLNFELGKILDAVYLCPMPNSWSEKKKERMNGLPCETKHETDNITKAIKDTFRKNDSDIWWEKAEKRWSYRGSIIIFQ